MVAKGWNAPYPDTTSTEYDLEASRRRDLARMERRLLRLMRMERLARMRGISTTIHDIEAIATAVEEAAADWRLAVRK